jgi:hypothetical protein
MNREYRLEASSKGGINITGWAVPSAGAAAQFAAGKNIAIIADATNPRTTELDMTVPFLRPHRPGRGIVQMWINF